MQTNLQAAEGTAQASGSVQKVILYRGQALVTRNVPLDDEKGALELIVSDLPAHVIPSSLFAEGEDGIQIRAVRYRARAVGQEPREAVRKLDEQIDEVGEELQQVGQMHQIIEKRFSYLDKLEGFVAPTATTELTKGVLNAEALERLTTFSFDQREAAVKKLLQAQRQEKQLNRKLALLQRQRNELAAGASQTIREAVVFLEKRRAGKGAVSLSYLVAQCGWSPSYNLRANADGKEVQIEYNAVVHQMTGEDWLGVELTLSTASPTLSAKGPGLAPFQVVLTPRSQANQQSGQSGGDFGPQQLAKQLESIKQRRKSAEEKQQQAQDWKSNLFSSWEINAAVNDFQALELAGRNETLVRLQNQHPANLDGPSLNYPLEGTVSMASRSDQQIVQIMNASIQGKLYHVATPVLTSYVYREVELSNSSPEDLLAGPVHVYLDGRFMGRSEMGTVARGQTFVIGFGADPQLRTQRELVKKSESVQGGNRKMTFEYRLAVDNFKAEPVTVRVVDRLPFAERESEVRVTLADMKDKLSDDAFYLRRERPKGLLRWDVVVPAAGGSEDARVVQYSYTIEFDRNMNITTPGQALVGKAQPAQKEDFEMLERSRLYQH